MEFTSTASSRAFLLDIPIQRSFRKIQVSFKDSQAHSTVISLQIAGARMPVAEEEERNAEESRCIRLWSRQLWRLLCHIPLCRRLYRKPRGSQDDGFAGANAFPVCTGHRRVVARSLRRTTQRDGAAVVQAGLDAGCPGAGGAQHLRTALQPGVDRPVSPSGNRWVGRCGTSRIRLAG